MLRRYIAYTKVVDEVRRRVSQAVVYPIVLIVFSIGVVWVLLTYAIPRFAEFYTTFGKELPLITTVLIALSTFLNRHWPFIAARRWSRRVVFVRWLWQREAGRLAIDRLQARACRSSARCGRSSPCRSSPARSRRCCAAASRWSRRSTWPPTRSATGVVSTRSPGGGPEHPRGREPVGRARQDRRAPADGDRDGQGGGVDRRPGRDARERRRVLRRGHLPRPAAAPHPARAAAAHLHGRHRRRHAHRDVPAAVPAPVDCASRRGPRPDVEQGEHRRGDPQVGRDPDPRGPRGGAARGRADGAQVRPRVRRPRGPRGQPRAVPDDPGRPDVPLQLRAARARGTAGW